MLDNDIIQFVEMQQYHTKSLKNIMYAGKQYQIEN